MKTSRIKWALTLSAAALVLAACGGNDPAPVFVATADLSVPLAASSGGALVGTTITFDGGVAAFGTTTTTTLAVSGTAATQTATISADGKKATGDMGYGSCIFVIKTSDFSDASSLGVGKTLTVNPCNITVTTKGLVANGGETLSRVQATLGTASGAGAIRVTITPDGVLKVGSSTFANITLALTGGGS